MLLVLTCSTSTLVRGVLNVCYLWIASEQLSQKERDKGIHYTVLAALTFSTEFISSCTCLAVLLSDRLLSADHHLFGQWIQLTDVQWIKATLTSIFLKYTMVLISP